MLSRPVALVVAPVAALLLVALLSNATSGGAAGTVITSPDTVGNVGYGPSLVLDASGNPVVSYNAGIPDNDLKVLHCGDPNCSSGNVITSPDTVGSVGQGASLVLDGSGNPVVSYYDLTNEDLKVLHCGDPNCNSGNSITSPDTAGKVGRQTSLALDAGGNPVVSYLDATNEDLKVLHCNDPNCSGGDESITSPDTNGFVGRHSSLALDGSGNPVVSYNGNGDLKVLHCNDPNCSGGDESITSPDTAGSVGFDTSLALDSGGNPVVSYEDRTNEDLKVLHCNDPNCSGGDESITSPDTAGVVGWGTSLALDGGGNPVVSYYDNTNGDLKLLRCGDANCSSGNSITAPDVAGNVGEWTSLALDGVGNPVVGYYYDDTHDLKVMHCGDPNCSAPPPLGDELVWGDNNCSGSADAADALLAMRRDAGLITDTGACPDLGRTVEVLDASLHFWGDVNCDDDITPADALALLRYHAGLAVIPAEGCPLVGSHVFVRE